MVRAEELVRAAAGGAPAVLEVLRREAQHLGGDVLLAPTNEAIGVTWTRALVASAICHAGPGSQSSEGSLVHGARIGAAKALGKVLEPLAETERETSPLGDWIDVGEIRVRRKGEEAKKKETPGWLFVFTQEGAQETVVLRHRDGLWLQTATPMEWRFGLPAYNTASMRPWESELAGVDVGFPGLKVFSPWFETDDEWTMMEGHPTAPWILATQYVAVCATRLSSLAGVLQTRKMLGALPLVTLINKTFARMKDAEYEEGIEWAMGRGNVKEEGEGEKQEALREKLRKESEVRVLRNREEALGRREGIRRKLAGIEWECGEWEKEERKELVEGLEEALGLGLIEEATITSKTTWMRMGKLVTPVTARDVALAKARGKAVPAGGPGMYQVEDAVVGVPHDAGGSGLRIYNVDGEKHPHPHLAYGDARPCLGHGEAANEENVRILTLLWEVDVVGWIKWVRNYLGQTNLDAGYRGVWEAATRIGELPVETEGTKETPSGARVVRVQ